MSSFGYNVANQLTGLTYGNGVAATIGYSSNRLQMSSLSYAKSGTTLFGLTYSYGTSGSNNGQISGITDSVDNGRSATYTYDALARLSTAGTTGSTGYAYVENDPIDLADPSGLCPGGDALIVPVRGTDIYRTVCSTPAVSYGIGHGGWPGAGDTFLIIQTTTTAGDDPPITTITTTVIDLGPPAGSGGGGSTSRGDTGGSPQTQLNLSQKGQVCEAKVQSAVNTALNTSTTFLGPQMGGHQDDPRDPGLINGAYNFIFFAPGVQFGAGGSHAVPGANCGRFPGSGLHIPVNGGGCNPSGDPNSPFGFNAQQNGSYFTAHMDSANPYDDLFGFFSHLINNVILRRPHGC